MTDLPNLPTNSSRTVVIGSTGSGKTVWGVWLLSTRRTLDWNENPVMIVNTKSDALLDSLGAKEWDLRKGPPRKPGLYICHPDPEEEMPEIDAFLHKCWEAEDIGLFFDEGGELEKSRSIRRIMSQGRSKHIPCITCTQRPLRLPLSIFTEADYFALLRLNYESDRKRVGEYMNTDVHRKLGRHCSIWYDVAEDRANDFKPVPSPSQIRSSIRWANTGQPARKVV